MTYIHISGTTEFNKGVFMNVYIVVDGHDNWSEHWFETVHDAQHDIDRLSDDEQEGARILQFKSLSREEEQSNE